MSRYVPVAALLALAAAFGFATATRAQLANSYAVQLHPGWNVIANQLNQGGNTLGEVLPWAPPGSMFYQWNAASQTYAASFFEPEFGGWDDPSLTLRPGEGGFLMNPTRSPFTITFAGAPATPRLPLSLPQDMPVLIARQIPAPATYEQITGLPPVEGATLYRYDAGRREHPSDLANWQAYTFSHGSWTPSVPRVGVGEPVFVQIPSLPARRPPLLASIDDRSVDELSTLAFVVNAIDPNSARSNTIALSVQQLPDGASFDPSTGAFSWSPTEAQGPGIYPVTFTATDDGLPPLSVSQTVNLTVREINATPMLEEVRDFQVSAGDLALFDLRATDDDLPSSRLTFHLESGAPGGAFLDPDTGTFFWATTETDGGCTYPVTVRVSDDGTPSRTSSTSFSITVNNPLRILALDRQRDAAVLSWSAMTGATYRVLYTANLADESWHALPGDIQATTNVAQKVDGTVDSTLQRFYRITTVPASNPPPTIPQDPPPHYRECHWELLGEFYHPERRVHKFMLMRCGVAKTCRGHANDDYGFFASEAGTVNVEAIVDSFVDYHSLNEATKQRLKDTLRKAAWWFETPSCWEAGEIIQSLKCKHGPSFCDLYKFTPSHTLPNPNRSFENWTLLPGQEDRDDFRAGRWLDYKVAGNSLLRGTAISEFFWRDIWTAGGSLARMPRAMGSSQSMDQDGTHTSHGLRAGEWAIQPKSDLRWSLDDKCRLINTYEDKGAGEGEARVFGAAARGHKITADAKTAHHVEGCNSLEYRLENRNRDASGSSQGTPPDPGTLDVDVKFGFDIPGVGELGFSAGSGGMGTTIGPISVTWKPGSDGQPPSFDSVLQLTGSDTGSHTANAHLVRTTHDAKLLAQGWQPYRGAGGHSFAQVKASTHAHHNLQTGYQAKPVHGAEQACGCGAQVCHCDPEARVHLLPWSDQPTQAPRMVFRSAQASGFRVIGPGGARDGNPTLSQQDIVETYQVGSLVVDGKHYTLTYVSKTREYWLNRIFTNALQKWAKDFWGAWYLKQLGTRLAQDEVFLRRDAGSIWVE